MSPATQETGQLSCGRAGNVIALRDDRSLVERIVGQVERTASIYTLNLRESEVLALLMAGDSAPDISRRLGIPVSTIRYNIARISRKLGARNTAQALVIAASEADS